MNLIILELTCLIFDYFGKNYYKIKPSKMIDFESKKRQNKSKSLDLIIPFPNKF